MYQPGRCGRFDNIRPIEFRYVKITKRTRCNIDRISNDPISTLCRVEYPGHVQRAIWNRLGDFHKHADDPTRTAPYGEAVTDPSSVESDVRPDCKLLA
jgi:hypothetical protein